MGLITFARNVLDLLARPDIRRQVGKPDAATLKRIISDPASPGGWKKFTAKKSCAAGKGPGNKRVKKYIDPILRWW